MTETDTKKGIVEYVKKNISKGYDSETLKWALISQGYSRSIIEKSIEQAHRELAQKVPILREKPVIKQEVFGENNQPMPVKKPWWKRLFGL